MSEATKVLLKGFEFPDDKKPSKEDMKTVSDIVKVYSNRSTQLLAAAIASLIKLQCPEFPSLERDIIVAIDGSIYHNYHKYSSRMNEHLGDLQKTIEDERTKLSGIKDGGCIGAAITAMLYSDR